MPPSDRPGQSSTEVRLARGRRRPRARWLALAGLVVALAWVVLSRRSPPGPQPPKHEEVPMLVDEETCYVGFLPTTTRHLRKDGTPLQCDLATDADGFRVGARPHPASPRCRILVAGDSFTAGLWVQGDEAFPAVLEQLLDDAGYSVRVDNGGAEDQTIAQERTGLVSRWRDVGEQIAIVATGGNDLTDLAHLMRRHCRLAVSPAGELHPLGDRDPIAADLHRSDPEDADECDRAADEYVREAVDTAKTLRARGKQVIFDVLEPVGCPAREGAWSEADKRDFGDRLARSLGPDTPVLFDHGLYADERLGPWDGHPSVSGHRLIAKQLADKLVALGWLERCR